MECRWGKETVELRPHFLFLSAPDSTLATPSALRATVSLRLGHGAALTCHRHVIHYRAAASLPIRGAKGEVLPRSAAPTRGSPQCAHWGKGSPELSLEQMGKERADLNNHCHSEERSDVGIRSSLKQQCFLHGVKETRIATASLRTGLAMTVVFYTLPFLLPIGTLCPLATPQSAYG